MWNKHLVVVGFPLFCSQRSEIASDRFLAIPGKVLPGRTRAIYRKKELNSSVGWGGSLATQHSSRRQSRPKGCSPLCRWPSWAMGCSTLCPALLVTYKAQVQTICLCSPGQPHCFTRCSITSSSCFLMVPLHSKASFLVHSIVKFKHACS